MRFRTGPSVLVEEGAIIERRGIGEFDGGAAVCGGGDWVFVGL